MLFVLGRLLYPTDTGAKIRTARLLEHLSKHHSVTCVTFRTPEVTSDDLLRMRACCERVVTVSWTESRKFTLRFYTEVVVNLFSSLPYTVRKYHDRRIQALLVQEATHDYDILVCDFLQPSVNLRRVSLRPQVLFEHNVESLIRFRQYRHEQHPVAKAYLLLDYLKLRRYERLAASRFDHCIMVSDADCKTMRDVLNVTHASSIPTGVDVDFFHPTEPEDARDLVFTGSMDWFPNEDAIRYFLREIHPRIGTDSPPTTWVVGRNPSRGLCQLANRYPTIRVTGTVEDVRPFIARAAVYIVPLRVGGGTRIKILEALAMGKAVVSTSIGAEGLPVVNGKHILIADDPTEFAHQIRRLLDDAATRRRLGMSGRELVTTRLTWAHAARAFAEICEGVVARTRG